MWKSTHVDQLGVVVPVLRPPPVPEGGVLPVKVEAVEVVLPQVADGGLDERPPGKYI